MAFFAHQEAAELEKKLNDELAQNAAFMQNMFWANFIAIKPPVGTSTKWW